VAAQARERAAFNYRSGSYQNAVAATSDLHRVASLVIAG